MVQAVETPQSLESPPPETRCRDLLAAVLPRSVDVVAVAPDRVLINGTELKVAWRTMAGFRTFAAH